MNRHENSLNFVYTFMFNCCNGVIYEMEIHLAQTTSDDSSKQLLFTYKAHIGCPDSIGVYELIYHC
jgi:hypothetical protein